MAPVSVLLYVPTMEVIGHNMHKPDQQYASSVEQQNLSVPASLGAQSLGVVLAHPCSQGQM